MEDRIITALCKAWYRAEHAIYCWSGGHIELPLHRKVHLARRNRYTKYLFEKYGWIQQTSNYGC